MERELQKPQTFLRVRKGFTENLRARRRPKASQKPGLLPLDSQAL